MAIGEKENKERPEAGTDEASLPAKENFINEVQFRTLANSIPQLAWMADETGYIYWYNQRWYEYTGTTLEEMRGWGWRKVHRPELVDEITTKFQHHLQSGEEWEDTFPLLGRDGQYRWFLSRAKPVRDEKGRIVGWFGTNTDITDNREAARTKELLSSIVESSDDAIVSKDLNSIITSWNKGAEKLFGWTAEEAIGQSITIIIPKDRLSEEAEIIQRLKRRQKIDHLETIRITKDGRLLNISVTISPLVDPWGNIVGASKVARDITRRKELEASLRQAISELETADRKKNEFLAILGHELRNPLAALRGSVELLERKVSEPGEVLGIMQNSIGTMAKLLDDLLDLSRVSRNRIQLDYRVVDLKQVLDTAFYGVRAQYRERGQTLHQDVSASLFVKGDPTRLEQIFNNLLVNAGKYSPDNTSIEITGRREGGEVVVWVKDQGMGIEPEALTKVFDPFYQVTPEGKAASGLGIGLALAKNLAELHGGTIQAFSEGRYKGATFELRLPAVEASPPETETDSPTTDVVLPAGLTVVLIEDNEQVSMVFSLLLRRLGCTVHAASNGTNGLRLIKEHSPQAVLIDLGLPDMSGYDVASQLRAEGFDRLLIAISGYSHEEARRKSREAGFDHHLAKPARLEEVRELLMTVDK